MTIDRRDVMGQMMKQTPFSNVAHHTREAMASQLERGAERSAGQLDEVANALHQTSKQLDGNGAAQYIEKAAHQVERVSEYVRNADVNQMKGAVEGFARREPLLFIGGAFALGMLGARFLKSSSRNAPIAEQGDDR